MRTAQIAGPALGAMLAIGCTEPLPTELAEGPLFQGSGPVVQSVTGSGHTTRDLSDTPDVWRTFSITARKYLDGTVEGQLQVKNHAPGRVPLHAIVTCMAIDGNQAWLGVEFTKPDRGKGILRVVDNGQGENADPDRISFIAEDGDAARSCEGAVFPLLLLRDVESGNIQVKG